MSSGRPLRIVAAAGSAFLLLLVGLTGCSGSDDRSAPTLREVAALLARHGAAVMAHDRHAFLADVDDAPKAITFWRDQASEFDNLARLPLARWSYTVDAPTGDHAAQAAAGRRLGAKALVVKIDLRYAVRRADPVPSTRSLWWTFVRRDGHVVVAGDDALADAGGTSWRGPWDFGRLTIVRGSSSLVLGHADPAGLSAVAATVDAAIPAVSAVWGDGWTRYVAVIVPATEEELSSEVDDGSPVSTADAAAAVSDAIDPLTGALLGQRLIVNPDVLTKLTALGRQIVIRHEVTHIAAGRFTTDSTPRWLAEGFAEYVANLGSGQPPKVAAAELRAEVAAGRIPDRLPDEAAFDTTAGAAPAYEGAWFACRLIAAKLGAPGLVQFYRLVGGDLTATSADAAASAAMRSLLHESLARFTAEWRTYITRLLG